ncbi:hypothetical protein GWK47_014787 [Chionoecetes opilio]|uniref:Uncharacterized protein n=1 Tax=Chionoecetes opilio TaxID=41210 RepID=A0A8J4XVN7_CHIOP|nr:hypothetical protein GWK47_014787 [Chionoecetes opilio]
MAPENSPERGPKSHPRGTTMDIRGHDEGGVRPTQHSIPHSDSDVGRHGGVHASLACSHVNSAVLPRLTAPPAAGPDKDWVHAAAESARTLDVARIVRCNPDLPLPDHLPMAP